MLDSNQWDSIVICTLGPMYIIFYIGCCFATFERAAHDWTLLQKQVCYWRESRRMNIGWQRGSAGARAGGLVAVISVLWSAMVGNPYRYRAALQQLDNRHATAGCLLALLFVIPFAASSCSMAALLVSAALYSAVVVPVAAGLLPLSAVIGRLRSLLQALERSQALGVLRQAWFCSLWLHEVYSQLDGIHATTNQVLFFLLSEKLLCPDQRLSCLYVLLCYTVLAYLWRSLHTRQWSQLLHETSAADFIKLTTAFVVVRLGRGVAMSLVLLTFSLHFNHLEPGGAYVLFTATFFLLTQYRGEAGEETAAVSCARYLDLPVLEGLEEYWVPLLVRATAVLMSALVACVAALDASLLPLALLVGYSNVYVAGLRAAERLWEPLESQLAVVSAFPLASRSELRRRGDSTCAVCLDEMRPPGARVTPCDHVFHGACLRRCALQFGQCPLCKAPL